MVEAAAGAPEVLELPVRIDVVTELQQVAAKEDDYSSLRDSADSLVAQHLTDDAEVQRVLGSAED